MEDQRFQSLIKDPRCRDIPKSVRKVKVDKRFQKMLKHKQFKGNNIIDERGRKVNFSTTEKLKKLYNLKESSEEDGSSSEDSYDKQDDFEEKKSSPLKTKKNEKTKKVKSVNISEDKGKNLEEKITKRFQKDKTKAPKLISDLPENMADSDDDSSEEEDESADSKDESENIEKDSTIEVQKSKTKNPKSKKSDNLPGGKLSGDSEEESDSEDSDDSDSADDIFADPDEFDHNWEEWHEEAPDTDKIFKRLAVCNMDWDRIRADDLFTVFNSFKPAAGTINSVKIYPSDFGLKRMEVERLKGPPELVEETLNPDTEEKLSKRRAKFHREKLREYQLKRLQYYYAVVDCDSPETADYLYVELNGKEFESSSVRFDLRFIPDDTSFDHEPASEAYKVPDPSEYRPRYFVSTALGQAKVDLTWDETDPHRQEILERAFKEPDNIEKDIKDYLASSSGESEVEEMADDPGDKKMKLNERISKYKELLHSLEEKDEEEKYDMEISWQPDLKEKTEKLVKQKLEEPKNLFDEMIKKKKEERKLKKQKKNANKDEEGSNSESDDYSDASTDDKPAKKVNKKLDELYLISDSKKALDQPLEKSSKKKKKKNKQQKSEPEKTQDFKFVKDERFSAIYTSPEFNLDPSDPHFKKTEGNLAFIQEKQRRLKNKEPPTSGNRKNKKSKYW